MSEKNHRALITVGVTTLGIIIGVAGTMVKDRISFGERGAATAIEVVDVKDRVAKLEETTATSKEFNQFEKRVDQQFSEVNRQLAEIKQLLKRRGQ